MGPEISFIKLKNGAEVSLLNDDKETGFLEAKLSKNHPEFKPTRSEGGVSPKSALKKKEVGTKKNTKKSNKTFSRQGTGR